MIEDYVKDQKNKERKTYAPVAFGTAFQRGPTEVFNLLQRISWTILRSRTLFTLHLGYRKTVIVLTDNKSLTSFFQSKAIPPSLWNFLDRLLSFNLVIAHIPAQANYAADFLSRVQTDPVK